MRACVVSRCSALVPRSEEVLFAKDSRRCAISPQKCLHNSVSLHCVLLLRCFRSVYFVILCMLVRLCPSPPPPPTVWGIRVVGGGEQNIVSWLGRSGPVQLQIMLRANVAAVQVLGQNEFVKSSLLRPPKSFDRRQHGFGRFDVM